MEPEEEKPQPAGPPWLGSPDSSGQQANSTELIDDIRKYLIRFLPLQTLGLLSSASKAYAVWAHVKSIPEGLPAWKANRLIAKLVEFKANIESIPTPFKAVETSANEALFTNSAPTLKVFGDQSAIRLSRLNCNVIEQLQAPICRELVSLLQEGCPNLRSLTLRKGPESDDLAAPAAAAALERDLIDALTGLENLTSLSLLWDDSKTPQMQWRLSQAVIKNNQLRFLSLWGPEYTQILNYPNSDTVWDPEKVDKICLDTFGIPSTRLRISDQVVATTPINELILHLALGILTETQVSTAKRCFEFLLTRGELALVSNCLQDLAQVVNVDFDESGVMFDILVGESLAQLLFSLDQHPYFTDFLPLIDCVNRFLGDEKTKLRNEMLVRTVSLLISAVKTAIERNRHLFGLFFESKSSLAPANLVRALFSDESWLMQLGLDTATADCDSLGRRPFAASCDPSVAHLFFTLKNFKIKAHLRENYKSWFSSILSGRAWRISWPEAVPVLVAWFKRNSLNMEILYEAVLEAFVDILTGENFDIVKPLLLQLSRQQLRSIYRKTDLSKCKREFLPSQVKNIKTMFSELLRVGEEQEQEQEKEEQEEGLRDEELALFERQYSIPLWKWAFSSSYDGASLIKSVKLLFQEERTIPIPRVVFDFVNAANPNDTDFQFGLEDEQEAMWLVAELFARPAPE